MRRTVTLLFVLALAAPGFAAEADEAVGFFASLKGEVEVATPLAAGAYSWHAARQDAEVRIGDRIRTGTHGAASIVLVDDTMLHVDEDTELEIEVFHVGDAATREKSVVRHTRGRLRTIVGDAFGGSTKLEIHTPTAVVGVKGTDLETSEASLPNRNRFLCCLHTGGIHVSNDAGSASPKPGQCLYAEEGHAPGPAFPNPNPPFVAPGSSKPDEGDFSEPVHLEPQPGPANDDPQDDDALQIFELPDGPPPITPPAIVAVP